MIVAIHTIVKSAQKTSTKKVQLSSSDSNVGSTTAGSHAIVDRRTMARKERMKVRMRQQLKEQSNTDCIEYFEIERQRLEELEEAKEELEALEETVTLVKNTLFFIFVFAMGVILGIHL